MLSPHSVSDQLSDGDAQPGSSVVANENNQLDDTDDLDEPNPPPPAAALLDDADVERCSRDDLLAMLRDLLADRVRLLRRHSRTVDQLGGRLRLRSDELQSLRQSAESVGRENADLRRLLAGVESERLRLMDTGRQWQVLAGQSGSALANQLGDLRAKVAGLERLLGQLDSGRRLPADGQEASSSSAAHVAVSGGSIDAGIARRLDAVEASLADCSASTMSAAEALMLRHLLTLARQKAAGGMPTSVTS